MCVCCIDRNRAGSWTLFCPSLIGEGLQLRYRLRFVQRCNVEHRFLVAEELNKVSNESLILIAPESKNTTAAISCASVFVTQETDVKGAVKAMFFLHYTNYFNMTAAVHEGKLCFKDHHTGWELVNYHNFFSSQMYFKNGRNI